jgi:hypothetical protein
MSVRQVHVEDTLLPVLDLIGADSKVASDTAAPGLHDRDLFHNLYCGAALGYGRLKAENLTMSEGLKEGRVAAACIRGKNVEQLVLVEAGVGGDLILEDEFLDLRHMNGDLRHALQHLEI